MTAEVNSQDEKKNDSHEALPPIRFKWLPLSLAFLLFLGGNGFFYYLAVVRPGFEVIKLAYAFNTIVFPLVLCCVGYVGFRMWMRSGWDGRRLSAAAAPFVLALLCFGARIYATHIEPRMLVLREVTVESPKIDRPVRILHISDIQSDAVGAYEERAFARMRELKPDLILHTGDLLHPISPATLWTELPKIAALFETLNPPGGVWGVFGDVDWRIYKEPEKNLGGLKMLEGRETTLTLAGKRFRIFGLPLLESRKWMDCRKMVEQWLETTEPEDFTILLGHAPDFVLDIQDLPIDLCLAGHTHGGQIRIPFHGPILTLSAVPKEWARGYREVGKTRLNVSAGVGSEHAAELPAIRVNCPTEMSLIELR